MLHSKNSKNFSNLPYSAVGTMQKLNSDLQKLHLINNCQHITPLDYSNLSSGKKIKLYVHMLFCERYIALMFLTCGLVIYLLIKIINQPTNPPKKKQCKFGLRNF